MRSKGIILMYSAVALAVTAASDATPAEDKDLLAALVNAWRTSPHGNYHSPSFTYWNKEGEVAAACAACHSQPGFTEEPFHAGRRRHVGAEATLKAECASAGFREPLDPLLS